MLLFSRGHKLVCKPLAELDSLSRQQKPSTCLFYFFSLPSPQKINYYNYLWIQSALVCLQKMCNFNKSAKNISISVSLWFGHVKNMRACIVVELPMLCTGFCLSSVLVHSVCDAWWWEKRDGMALWSVGVGFLCGNSWSTTHILYSLCFCIFVRSCNIKNS